MDGVTVCPVELLNEAEQSCQPQELRPSSNNNTPTKVPRRKGSVFSLAGSFFKSHGKNDELDHTRKQQDSPPIKGSWNPFTSLRLKESKKSTSFVTTRCKSSSPQKGDTLRLDEIGKRKTMRRKSLQDLLGTMGTKLSRGRRQVLEEVNSPSREDRDEEHRCPLFPSPGPVQLGRGEAVDSPNDYRSGLKLMRFSDSKLGAQVSEGPPFMISPGRIVPTGDDSKSKRNAEKIDNEVLELVKCTGVSQMGNDIETHKSPKGFGMSGLHDSIQFSATSLPEKMCTEELVSFLQDVSSQMQKHITFSSEEPPVMCLLNTVPAGTNSPPSTLHKGNSLDVGLAKGGYSFDSTLYESLPNTTDVSSKEIAKHIISTAAKISDNYHLSQIQNRRFLDNSESDADSISHHSWDATQPEVWDVIDKGREIIAKTMPTPYLYPEAMSEISSVEAALDCPTSKVSLVAGESPESFSGSVHIGLKAPKAENNNSSDSIQVFHPRSGFRGPFTSRHISMSDALSDLYYKNTYYSTYCLFDRENMTLIPQPSKGYLDTERPQQVEGGLEVIRLQMQSRSAHRVSAGPHISGVECQPVPSTGAAGSSLNRQCAPFVCIPGPLVSRIGIVVSEFSESQPERVESICETEINSVAAGYSLISHSSTDSMNPSKIMEVTHPGSTHSASHEINKATPKTTKPLKMWADLGKEFLDRRALESNSSLDHRAKIVVQESLKSCHGLHLFSEDEQDVATGHDRIEDAAHQKWSRDRESIDDVSLDDMEDIAEQESPSRFDTARDASGVGNMTMAAALRPAFRVETLASQKTFNRDLRSGYMSPMCSANMDRTSDNRIQQDQIKGWVSNAGGSKSFSGTANDEVSCADGVGTKKTSVDTITQDKDETGPIVAETSRKTLTPAKSPKLNDHRVAVPLASTQKMSDLSVTTSPASKGGVEVAASTREHEGDSTVPRGQGNPGFADLKTDQISTCPAVLETMSTIRELPEFRSQSFTSAEALSTSLFPTPRLLTPPTRAKISPYSPIIPSPLSGQKRVRTPGQRVLTPLATMYQPGDFEVQTQAPPPSEADTEESFDFGLELQKCALTWEDDKENGGRWNKSFTLYGHRIHYTGLEDTI